MPKVSVIMGVYNIENEEILSKSICSILNQTFTDFEFIICDDGSSNDSYIWIQKYERIDKRIKLIKNSSNMGLAFTLNKCIQMSHGKYIARQDADDYSEQNRLQIQIDFLETHKEYSFVGSNMALFKDEDSWGKYRLPEMPEKKDFLFQVPFMHATVIFRKEALMLVDSYCVSKETRRCEDLELFMKLYSYNFIGCNIQQSLYCCREDNNSFKRRKFRYRIDEVKIRYQGFKRLKLFPKGYIYLLKPLIVGVMPNGLLRALQDLYYKRR